MKPAPFTYHRPATVAEAVRALADAGDDGKVLAGGQSLVPLLSMRLAAPEHLVDIGGLPALDGIEVTDTEVRVGALVRHADLERHEAAFAAIPLLRKALRHVAHPTIRNRGTVVGSVCHADPAAELPAVLVLLGGRVTVTSVSGEREIDAADLYTGPLETSLRPDELATSVAFARPAPHARHAIAEVARRNGDYAVCGVVAEVTGESRRASYISVGSRPEVVDLTDPAARNGVRCAGDIHASAAYRARLVEVLTARVLEEASRA